MKKHKFLSMMVVASLLLCVLYGVIAIIFQWITGSELSPTLTEKWFQIFGIEIGGTTLIYIVKRIVSIWRIEDKIELKKKEGFELKESDFDTGSEYPSYFVSDDPTYDDESDLMG